MAEYYSAELSQKVKREMNETRLKGNFTGEHLLYGYNRGKPEVFKNIYPAIISAEIYEQVRHKINLNRYSKRSTEIDYLLRNKLECGYCNKTTKPTVFY